MYLERTVTVGSVSSATVGPASMSAIVGTASTRVVPLVGTLAGTVSAAITYVRLPCRHYRGVWVSGVWFSARHLPVPAPMYQCGVDTSAPHSRPGHTRNQAGPPAHRPGCLSNPRHAP